MNDVTANRFVERQLERLHGIERDIIRLYAECCYASIQGACGNQSCAERVDELNQEIREAGTALKLLKEELRRLGIPREAMISLDDLEKLDIFEAQFRQHDAAFGGQNGEFGRGQLIAMLEDIAVAKD
jgi:hypothetical protein